MYIKTKQSINQIKEELSCLHHHFRRRPHLPAAVVVAAAFVLRACPFSRLCDLQEGGEFGEQSEDGNRMV
jgi:hypothetical protein